MFGDTLFEIEFCRARNAEKNMYVSVMYVFTCHLIEMGHF